MTYDLVDRSAASAGVGKKSVVRCRLIGEADVNAVIELLMRGMPGRSHQYWGKGFERLKTRQLLADVPRYGFLLESDGTPVGAIVLIYADNPLDPQGTIRCNLSSWYVEPSFRSLASLLISFALKHKHVTYFNISPGTHTWPIIEAQGFKCYASGQCVSIPALNSTVPRCRVKRLTGDLTVQGFSALPERALLVDHAGMGCLSLVVESSDGFHPFVFQRSHLRWAGIRVPVYQLIYCRDVADYVRFAGSIGRFMLLRGVAFVIHDANRPETGLIGWFGKSLGRKYFRGPTSPRLGDLAYTEWVWFGPPRRTRSAHQLQASQHVSSAPSAARTHRGVRNHRTTFWQDSPQTHGPPSS